MSRTFALSDAAQVIHQLTLSYGQPYGLSTAATEDLAKQWAKVLDDCRPADVLAVVEQHIKREKKWPTASKIRDDALKLEAATQRKSTSSYVDGEFCPMCHTRDLISVERVGKNYITGAEVRSHRFMPFHADNCPGLHDDDRKALRAAIDVGTPAWKNGKAPRPDSTTDRLTKHQQRESMSSPAAEVTT